MTTKSEPAAQGTQVRRAFALIKCLSGHEYDGLRLTQIANAIGDNAPSTLRTLELLADIGVVQRDPRNETLWRLGPMLIQLSVTFHHHVAQKQREIEDFTRNYLLNPN